MTMTAVAPHRHHNRCGSFSLMPGGQDHVSACGGVGGNDSSCSSIELCPVRESLDRLGESLSNLNESFCRRSSDAVVVGKLMGSGKFSDVYEAQFASSAEESSATSDNNTLMRLPSIDDDHDHDHDDNGRISSSSSSPSRRKKKGPSKLYVLKHLKNSLASDDVELFRVGADDLATEADILSALAPHVNVVRFHGTVGYDLLLEKLTSTLTDRLSRWKSEERPYRKGKLPLTSPQTCRIERRRLLRHRLESALDVARGLRHLHSEGVMHRDLKPDNIGFDEDGTAKIFDFGLAKKLVRPSGADGTDERRQRKYTGLVGTFRYMAPEVAKCRRRYDERVDLYSYGLILWGICAMDVPFGSISRKDFQENVVYGDRRPHVSSRWPPGVGGLMTSCWSERPDERPSCEALISVLEYETSSARAEEESVPPQPSRRRVSRRASSRMFGCRRASMDMVPASAPRSCADDDGDGRRGGGDDVADSDDDDGENGDGGDAASLRSCDSRESRRSSMSTCHARIPTTGNGNCGGGGKGKGAKGGGGATTTGAKPKLSRRGSLFSKALSTRF